MFSPWPLQEAELDCCNAEMTMYAGAPLTFDCAIELPEGKASMADEIASIK
jgi:hypothetical protein